MVRTFSGSNHKKIRTFRLSPKIRHSYKKKECINQDYILPVFERDQTQF